MSDFSDFKAQIADWINRQDCQRYSDVTGFVRDAEAKLNAELRIDRMIQTDDALIAARCAPLPDDWLEMDFVRLAVVVGLLPVGLRADRLQAAGRVLRHPGRMRGRNLHHRGPADLYRRPARHDRRADGADRLLRRGAGLFRRAGSVGSTPSIPVSISMPRLSRRPPRGWRGADGRQLEADVRRDDQKLNAPHRYSRASGSRLSRTRTGGLWMMVGLSSAARRRSHAAHYNRLCVTAHCRSRPTRAPARSAAALMRARGRRRSPTLATIRPWLGTAPSSLFRRRPRLGERSLISAFGIAATAGNFRGSGAADDAEDGEQRRHGALRRRRTDHYGALTWRPRQRGRPAT